MTSCAVFIATTGGPVQILQITPERAPQSMVCLNRTTNVLPVSPLYDQFVKPGSGVVEREFGPFDHASFRADVSGPIDTGNSWQLAVFLAHAIQAAPDHRLAEDPAEAEAIIWATGCVDYHLDVTQVDHVTAKIEASVDAFRDWAAMGKSATLITAAGANESDARAGLSGGDVFLAGVENTSQAGELLGLAAATQSTALAAPVTVPVLQKLGSARNVAFAALAVVLVGGAGFAALQPEKFAEWSGKLKRLAGLPEATNVAQEESAAPLAAKLAPAPPFTPTPPPAAPAVPPVTPPTLSVVINRLMPPAGGKCRQVHFGAAEPALKPVAELDAGGYGESDRRTTCGLRFDFDGGGKYIAAHLRIASGRYVVAAQKPTSLSGSQPAVGLQSWTIQLPQKAKAPFAYELAVLASDKPLGGQLQRLQGLPDLKAAKREFAQNQVRLLVLSHRVSAQEF